MKVVGSSQYRLLYLYLHRMILHVENWDQIDYVVLVAVLSQIKHFHFHLQEVEVQVIQVRCNIPTDFLQMYILHKIKYASSFAWVHLPFV